MKHHILLLGLGFWGSRWLNIIMQSPRSELAGIAGSRPELDRACQEAGIKPDITFTDFREAIAKTDAEVAIVVLPGVLHFEADKLALEKGMHIITEKPLAMDMEETGKLLLLKAKYPRQKFMASQNYRWRPHTQTMKKAITDGMIGKMESILLEFRQQEDLQGYRAGLEQPLLQDVCIHHFDLIRFFSGSDCAELFCRTWRPAWSAFQGRPNTDAIINMKNGVSVTYSGTWAARGKESSWDGNFTITGDRGCLTLDADNVVRFYPFEKVKSVVLDASKQEGVVLQQVTMEQTEMEYGFSHFLDCIEQGKTPETTLEDNCKSFAMVSAGLRSAALGTTVECF